MRKNSDKCTNSEVKVKGEQCKIEVSRTMYCLEELRTKLQSKIEEVLWHPHDQPHAQKVIATMADIR